MKYEVNINGTTCEMPQYSIKISEKIESVEKIKATSNVRTSLEEMYKFIADIIGKQVTEECIGKMNVADPNTINIAYLNIIDAYNKPLIEYQTEKRIDKIDTEEFRAIREILSNSENLAKFIENK